MADRKAYKREFVKNYRYIKIHFRRGNPADDEMYQYLTSKVNLTEYIKSLIQKDMEDQKKAS